MKRTKLKKHVAVENYMSKTNERGTPEKIRVIILT